jgi:hypothetical protein
MLDFSTPNGFLGGSFATSTSVDCFRFFSPEAALGFIATTLAELLDGSMVNVEGWRLEVVLRFPTTVQSFVPMDTALFALRAVFVDELDPLPCSLVPVGGFNAAFTASRSSVCTNVLTIPTVEAGDVGLGRLYN